jgi:hypothetical protein
VTAAEKRSRLIALRAIEGALSVAAQGMIEMSISPRVVQAERRDIEDQIVALAETMTLDEQLRASLRVCRPGGAA